MTRCKAEFPTEWSLCPEDIENELEQPPIESRAQDEDVNPAEPKIRPRVFAAGGSAPYSW